MKKRLLVLWLLASYCVAQHVQAKGMLDAIIPDILEVIDMATNAGMTNLTSEQVAMIKRALSGDIIKGDINQALEMAEKNKDLQTLRKQVQAAIDTAGKMLFKAQQSVFDAVRNVECALSMDGINAARRAYAQHMKNPAVQEYFALMQKQIEKMKDNVVKGLFDHMEGLGDLNQKIMNLMHKDKEIGQISHYINTVKEQLKRSILGNSKDPRRKAILDASTLERKAMDMAMNMVMNAAKTEAEKQYLGLLNLKIALSTLAKDVAMAGASMGSMAEQTQELMSHLKNMAKASVKQGRQNNTKNIGKVRGKGKAMKTSSNKGGVILGSDAASRHETADSMATPMSSAQ